MRDCFDGSKRHSPTRWLDAIESCMTRLTQMIQVSSLLGVMFVCHKTDKHTRVLCEFHSQSADTYGNVPCIFGIEQFSQSAFVVYIREVCRKCISQTFLELSIRWSVWKLSWKVKTGKTVLNSCSQLCEQNSFKLNGKVYHVHGLILESKERMNSRQDQPVKHVLESTRQTHERL